jgi:mannose-6-phosphate isomerase-like protein (cupin superfamily)
VTDYAIVNLQTDVEDQAPSFGLSPGLDARFARAALGLGQCGVSYQRIAPGFRPPFGHTHEKQEELYVILSGSGRMKIDDEVVDVRAHDAVRVAPGTWRALEAGPEGLELLAFGVRCGMSADERDVEMEQGWWSE